MVVVVVVGGGGEEGRREGVRKTGMQESYWVNVVAIT